MHVETSCVLHFAFYLKLLLSILNEMRESEQGRSGVFLLHNCVLWWNVLEASRWLKLFGMCVSYPYLVRWWLVAGWRGRSGNFKWGYDSMCDINCCKIWSFVGFPVCWDIFLKKKKRNDAAFFFWVNQQFIALFTQLKSWTLSPIVNNILYFSNSHYRNCISL